MIKAKISAEELKREKEYLNKTKEIIHKIIIKTNESVDYQKKGINELKRSMWKNFTDYTDEEIAIAMYETDNSVDITNRQIDSITKYEKSLGSPYFGKVVFRGDNCNDDMPIYIGITSVQDELNFYVFDWRSPISSMFYNYELGKAQYEAPVGNINGEIISKMQFKIENGNLVRCFQSDINIDDDYLQKILASSSSDRMKNIVSTIQKEQNEIIRNNRDRYLIVQGVAGSGKTSVALHRIAYLLYKDLKLSSNNILIFSPTNVFSDYISNVLPELGEDNVLKSTFSEFSVFFLKPYKSIESYSEFLERCYSQNMKNNDLISYKMSDKCQKDLQSFLKKYERSIIFKKGIGHANLLIDRFQLKNLFIKRFSNFPLKERIERMSEYVCSQLLLPKKKYFTAIKKQLCEFCEIDLDYMNLYKKFLMSLDLEKSEKNNDSSLQGKKIKYEDITGLLYLYFKINGYPSYSHIRQIVIDEAQDYTLFQIQLLKNIFNRASFTILGDVNQTINPNYNYEFLSKLDTIFLNSVYLKLTKTYRSSKEIINYSNSILGLENVCTIRKNNSFPVEIKNVKKDKLLSTLKKDLINMQNNGIKRIAIITKDIKQACSLHKMCLQSDMLDVQLVSTSNNSVNNDTIIIPSYLSKGLEFDGVISYSDSKHNYDEDERNLYYVVCTRAQHKLIIYNEPQRILKNLQLK